MVERETVKLDSVVPVPNQTSMIILKAGEFPREVLAIQKICTALFPDNFVMYMYTSMIEKI